MDLSPLSATATALSSLRVYTGKSYRARRGAGQAGSCEARLVLMYKRCDAAPMGRQYIAEGGKRVRAAAGVQRGGSRACLAIKGGKKGEKGHRAVSLLD